MKIAIFTTETIFAIKIFPHCKCNNYRISCDWFYVLWITVDIYFCLYVSSIVIYTCNIYDKIVKFLTQCINSNYKELQFS